MFARPRYCSLAPTDFPVSAPKGGLESQTNAEGAALNEGLRRAARIAAFLLCWLASEQALASAAAPHRLPTTPIQQGPVVLLPRLRFEPPACPSASPSPCTHTCLSSDSEYKYAHLFNGEARVEETDMKVKGRGLDFVWTRKYRSRAGVSSAQGEGWDFSYNVYLRAQGPAMLVNNGDARADFFHANGAGRWEANEFFQVLTRNPNGTYTMLFADKGKWNFNALDGSPGAGKISSSQDRNGNTITFTYDASGRLTTIVDTLGRSFQIAYGPNGRISSLTDFTGRQVVYEYYFAGDAGGSAGDLKSARSPVVTGTPNGNNFPSGKKTVYTYTTGFSNLRLNHNLLTITDPNGDTFLWNTYSSTLNPSSAAFDQLQRQVWGNPGDIIDFTFYGVTPTTGNNFARRETIVNDRQGNVSEYYYDLLNRLVMLRQFTGRANPDQPTTQTTNLPQNPLRPTDPSFFETRYSYNADSLIAKIVYPESNELRCTYELDLNPSADRRSRGNLRERRRLPGPLGGSQPELVEAFEYQSGFGGCCGNSFVTKYTGPTSDFETFVYDANGNRLSSVGRIPTIVEESEYNAFGQVTAHVYPDDGTGYRRRDEYSYYATGNQTGYLNSSVADVGGFALTNTYEYNARGILTRSIDRRGNDSLTILNELDQPVVDTSRAVSQGGVRYARMFFYDANDNVVRVDVENRDSQGMLQSNAYLTTTYTFGVLDELTQEIREVDAGHSLVIRNHYDSNRNLTLIEKGEATNGNDPNNVTRMLWDERDLLWRQTDGEGSASASTLQHDYDWNGRLLTVITGVGVSPIVHTLAYDGYGRVITTQDPMGNVHTTDYDANGNIVLEISYGELQDVAGSAGNVLLVRRERQYDKEDRITTKIEKHFDPVTGNPIGDGQATTDFTWNGVTRVTRTIDDLGHQRTFTHDRLFRLSSATDPAGNSSSFVYDANGSILEVHDLEKSDSGAADVTFVTKYEYDGLNRKTAVVDPLNHRTSMAYDSRDNLGVGTDAKGNLITYEYDGLDRLISVRRTLTNDGTGAGQVIGTIETQRTWDDSSRLVAEEDDTGNSTSYQYDSLDRMTASFNPDCTSRSYIFDVHGRAISHTDENGTVSTTVYDLDSRPTQRSVVSFGPGVSTETTFESYLWDGLGRLVRAQDDDSDVVRNWDSLSALYLEIQNGQPVVMTYDAYGKELSCIYPSGRTIHRTYDSAARLSTVNEAAQTIVRYRYVGPKRAETRRYPKPTAAQTTELEILYDGDRRVTQMTHRRNPDGAAATQDDRTFSWDVAHNKTARTGVLPILWDHVYQYDSTYRVKRVDRQRPMQASEVFTYGWDDRQNLTMTTGGPDAGNYTMNNALCEPADSQMNQYTSTPWSTRTYDASGNLAMDTHSGGPVWSYQYDYRNRLVRATRSPSPLTIDFDYDVLGRRIAKVLNGGATMTKFLYKPAWRSATASHLIEERDGSGSVLASYVHGRSLDEVVQMRRGVQDYYYHADDLGNIVMLTDGAGVVAERYEYETFGRPVTLSPGTVTNPFRFTGSYFDVETGFSLLRTRYLDSRSGRFISRDSSGPWKDDRNFGNAFAYTGGNPWTWMDRMGESTEDGAETCEETGEKLWFAIVDLEKCGADEEDLHEWVCNAYEAGEAAKDDIYLIWKNSTSQDDDAISLMEYWWGEGLNLSDSEEGAIWAVFDDVQDELRASTSSKRIKLECDGSTNVICNSGGGANAWTCGSCNIHMCEAFWGSWSGVTDDHKRSAILYHEFTHKYAGTDDEGYYEGSDHYGYPEWGIDGDIYSLSTADLINNADTYEMFLLDTGRYSGNSYMSNTWRNPD